MALIQDTLTNESKCEKLQLQHKLIGAYEMQFKAEEQIKEKDNTIRFMNASTVITEVYVCGFCLFRFVRIHFIPLP